MDADVAVIGVGSMGSFAFWHLAKMGVDVIGIEQFTPAHSKGAGHGESRIFRTSYAEGAEYVPLLKEARQLWREIESESGEELYLETGGLMIGRPKDGFLDGILESARLHDIPHEIFHAQEAQKLFPQHVFEPEDVIFYDQRSGVIKPELAIKTAIEQGLKHGGKLYAENPVTAIEPDQDGITIQCGEKSYRVGHAIIAAGAWTSKLLAQLNLPIWVERQVMLWYPARKPERFSLDQFGIFARVINGRNWYGFPSMDGETVKVAFHHGGDTVDPDTIDRTVHPEDYEELSVFVSKFLPDLEPKPISGQVCMYTNTKDNHFIVGQLPNMPHLTMLGPMAGHGFKFSPVIGKIGAELATGVHSELSIKPFSPERFIKTVPEV